MIVKILLKIPGFGSRSVSPPKSNGFSLAAPCSDFMDTLRRVIQQWRIIIIIIFTEFGENLVKIY